MYSQIQSKDAKNDVALFGSPGVVDFANCGSGPLRGMLEMGGALYALSGPTLYSVTQTGVATAVGGLVSGTGVVSMATNGEQLEIVNGVNGYIYSEDGGFTLITDTEFHTANSVTYIDSFFALDRAGTNEFFLSDSLDGTAYDGTMFASAEWQPDNVVSVLNHLERLNVFGAKSIEIYANTGAANFPFQRIKGAGFEVGIIGPHAKSTDEQSIYMIANDRKSYRIANGLAPFSTPAIEQAWQKYPVISDAFSFSFTFNGHRFVVFTFPTINETWVFDKTTNLWHERVSWDVHGQSLGRWRINCVENCYGKVLVGDAYSGKIGYLDGETYTEFGNTIQAELVSPPIHGNGKRVFMPMFELDIETGVGIPSGQGEDPQIMLSISDDGGRTWSDQQPWRSMGRAGQYGTRLRWDRLGSFQESRTLKVTISDPVKRVIIGARCPGLRTGI